MGSSQMPCDPYELEVLDVDTQILDSVCFK